MGKMPLIAQFRAGVTAARNYAASLFGPMALAMQEMEDTKADRGVGVRVTIQASAWTLQEDQAISEAYPYFYDLKADGVTAADRAEVTISVGSLSEAALRGLCPTCETGSGKIRLWSAEKPEKNIEAEYWIEQGMSRSTKEGKV